MPIAIVFNALPIKNGQEEMEIDYGYYLPSRKSIQFLLEFCERFLEKYNDESAIQKENRIKEIELEKDMERVRQLPKKEKMKYSGYIYFLHDEDLRTKIGKTRMIDKRILNIKPRLPTKSFLYHSISTNDTTKLEKIFHKKYLKYKTNGEWFNLPQSELSKIKKIESMEV